MVGIGAPGDQFGLVVGKGVMNTPPWLIHRRLTTGDVYHCCTGEVGLGRRLRSFIIIVIQALAFQV